MGLSSPLAAQWNRYVLPADLTINIPADWRPLSAGEEEEIGNGLRDWSKNPLKKQARLTPKKVLLLAASTSSGLQTAHITISSIPSDDPDDLRIRRQAFIMQLMADEAAKEKILGIVDTGSRTAVETQMADWGLTVRWGGTVIAKVGNVWGFLSDYEWVLPIKVGPIAKEEVWKVLEAKIWNNGQTCLIEIDYSRNFPEMAALVEAILASVRAEPPR